jgi:hypothetical protein
MGHVSLKLREAAWHDSLKLREAALPLRLYISPSLPISIYLSMFTSSAITARRAFPFSLFLSRYISLSISFSLSLSLVVYLTILLSYYPFIHVSVYLSTYLSTEIKGRGGGEKGEELPWDAVRCQKLAEMEGRMACRLLSGATRNWQKEGEVRGSREIARAARKW